MKAGAILPIRITTTHLDSFHDSDGNPLGIRWGLVKLCRRSAKLSDEDHGWRYISIGPDNIRLTDYSGNQCQTVELHRVAREDINLLNNACFLPRSYVGKIIGINVDVGYEKAAHWTNVINALHNMQPPPCDGF